MVQADYGFKDALKSLPASKWHKASKSWTYPATVAAARNMQNIMGIDTPANMDASSTALFSFLPLQGAAQKVKQHACGKDCPAWHHQGEAIAFIKDQPAAILNMPTGTGKTKTTIDLIQLRGHQFILVLTKKKAVSVWKKDVKKFLGEDAMNVVQLDTGSVVKNLKLAQAAAADTSKPIVLVTNYQSVWRDPFKSWLLKQSVDLLVLDESHSIKAPGGKASVFLKRLRKNIPCVVALTATFFGDKPIDIYGQMRTIDPAVFGTRFADFKERYCYLGGYTGKEIIGYKNLDEMMDKVAPFIFQVDKAVLNLIPVRDKRYYCKLPADVQKLYSKFSDEGFVRYDDDTVMSVDNPLTKLLRQQQITSGFLAPDEATTTIPLHTAKLETLTEILTDLPDAENVPAHTPVVVYCKFKEDLAGIRQVAGKLGYTYGEISGAIDQQEDFKAGKVNLLGCQIAAGGTGVDGLQEVCHVGIYYSTGYSLTEYVQSLGRLDRPGQTSSVLNIFIVTENTVDEDVAQALINKEDVIAYLNSKLQEIAKVG